ncbi:hypothetical protein FBU30_000859 [Linnemannia zychae]|nr:hypothetical protein FBU30_000859 [Linnemannia zychae]
MAPQLPSTVPESSLSPLATELYTFDTLLLTFQGRRALPTDANFRPVTSSRDLSTSPPTAQTVTEDANGSSETRVHRRDSKATSPLPPSFLSSHQPTLFNTVDETILSRRTPSPVAVASPLPASTSENLNTISTSDSGISKSNFNLPSWLELLLPSYSSSISPGSSGTPRDDSNINNSRDSINKYPSTDVIHGTSVKVKGGIKLGYRACQMLPEPIRLRHIKTTLLSIAKSSTGSEGLGLNSFAIEYFADQGCNQFVMATAGTQVNVWQAELDLIESNSEEQEARGDDDTIDSSGEHGDSMKLWSRSTLINEMDDKAKRGAKRQLSTSPLSKRSVDSLSQAATMTFTPWSPPPTKKHELKRFDRVVSVRWIGILKPSVFITSKAQITDHSPSPIRGVADSLHERSNENRNNNENADALDTDDINDHIENSFDIPLSKDNAGIDGEKRDSNKEIDNKSIPLSSPFFQDASNSSTEGRYTPDDQSTHPEEKVAEDDGFVSWSPFLETQLLEPIRRNVGPFVLENTVFNLANNPNKGRKNSTMNGGMGGGTFTGMSHSTSQIVMAGLIAGLLLILGSLLVAAYYRQRRRRWYEEDGNI